MHNAIKQAAETVVYIKCVNCENIEDTVNNNDIKKISG